MKPNEFIGLDEDLTENNLKQYAELGQLSEENQPGAPLPEHQTIDDLPMPMHGIRIVNIVASVDYGTDLDLLKIATGVRNAEYNPKRFPAATIRIQEPKSTALAFSNGKVNIVGCQNEDSAFRSARKFGRIFKQLGFTAVKIKTFRLSNIVAVMNCRFPIHLESLANANKEFVSYNPEIFAGLIYTIEKLNATLLIFVTGSIVVTGTKSIKDIYEAAKFIYPILVQFARGVKPLPPPELVEAYKNIENETNKEQSNNQDKENDSVQNDHLDPEKQNQ